MENNKKKLQIPSTCALLFMLMIVCAILTWIVPAGEFDTEKVGNLNKFSERSVDRSCLFKDLNGTADKHDHDH